MYELEKGDFPFSQLIFNKEGKRLLFVVDTQNDFVDQKRGLMAVPGGEEIVPGILARIKKAFRYSLELAPSRTLRKRLSETFLVS